MADDQQQPRRVAEPRRTAATQAWFAQLEALLGRLIASHRGAEGEVTRGPVVAGVGEDEQALLLDLARIAAHRSERWTAPVSTYLVGVALAPDDPDVRIRILTELVDGLEPGSG